MTPLTAAALTSVQTLLDRALTLDPGSRLALGKLSGRVLAVTCSAPAVTVYLVPDAQGLQLQGECGQTPDTHLRGSLTALLQTAGGASPHDTGVVVEGDAALLLELRRILARLDIDWEECLSQLLGDVVGHQGAIVLRRGFGWLRDRQRSGQRLLSEFFTEELRALPSGNELRDFYQQVDQLRLATDRAEARLLQLLQGLRAQDTEKEG